MQRLASALNTGAQEMARWEEHTGWESNPRYSFLVVRVTILPSGGLTCTSMAGREIVNLAPGTTLHKLLSFVSEREQVAEDRIRVVSTKEDLLNEPADSLVHHNVTWLLMISSIATSQRTGIFPLSRPARISTPTAHQARAPRHVVAAMPSTWRQAAGASL